MTSGATKVKKMFKTIEVVDNTSDGIELEVLKVPGNENENEMANQS